MSRTFTMRKLCYGCLSSFTITSSASKYCQDRECKNKRRREDYAARKKPPAPPVGSAAHLERAIRSGE